MIDGATHRVAKRPGEAAAALRRLCADRRGAAAFEMLMVYAILLIVVLLPLADVAMFSYKYLAAWEALRSYGYYIQYNPPLDVTNVSGWVNGLQQSANNFPITNIQVKCGDTTGTCSATTFPKYYTFSTTVKFSPMVLSSIICASSCTYTLNYSERFQ